MKTPMKNTRQRNTRKLYKNVQQSFLDSNSLNHHQFLQTPQCHSFQNKYNLYQTIASLTSLKSDAQLNQQQKNCANKLCKRFTKKTEMLKIEITQENLCESCHQQFKSSSFCLYCKQIYFDNTDDGKQWIMCEVCEKWVHTQCAQFKIKQNSNSMYKCIKCKKTQNPPKLRKNPVRCQIQKVEKKKTYEFLNLIGFQWQLNKSDIQNDMNEIKKYVNQN